MSIYTKGGDKGKTSIVGGMRVDKDNPRVEAIGAIDELNSHIGLLVALCHKYSVDGISEDLRALEDIQKELFCIGAGKEVRRECIENLEHLIDSCSKCLPKNKDFVIPGGCVLSGEAHVCRTVCRRAERRFVTLSKNQDTDANSLVLLNRLSDYLFVLARKLNFIQQVDEKIL